MKILIEMHVAFIVSYEECIAKQFWKKPKNFSQNCVCLVACKR
jgi:hypothetical protein